ncbi:MAG TPA: hypothetical protein VF484_04885 [Candidatus Limnocylindrales bacterium]
MSPRRQQDLEPKPGVPTRATVGPQASLGIQLGELVPWVREHPVRGIVTLLLALGGIGTLLNPPIEAYPNRLSPGDCISAANAAAPAGAVSRPIGAAGDVEDSINAGTAVRAACGLSHSHEVTAIMAVALPGHGSLAPSAGGSLVPVEASPASPGAPGAAATPATSADTTADADRRAIRTDVQAVCDAQFEAYVGHALTGSAYVTFAVIPSVAQLETGPQLAMCLVARADSQQMTSPAKNSGG